MARASGISHVGSVESFVFSLNKKRKGKQLQDPQEPGERGLGLPHWLEEAHSSPGTWPGAQRGWRALSLGMRVLVEERDILGSEAASGPEGIFIRV